MVKAILFINILVYLWQALPLTLVLMFRNQTWPRLFTAYSHTFHVLWITFFHLWVFFEWLKPSLDQCGGSASSACALLGMEILVVIVSYVT